MKKIVLSFALCLITLGIYADGSVSMGTAQVKQGKTSLVEVDYEITSGAYSAVELYFSMPEGVEVVTTDEDPSGAVVKATGENSGMQFIVKKSSLFTGEYASNSYVLLGYSGNLSSSGVLCYITIRAAATAEIKEHAAILNDNSQDCVAGHACFDTPTKYDLTVTTPFTVSVVADVLDLYDTDTDLPAASSVTENVVLHRNFTANVWNTLVLPFAVTNEQLKAAFGDDVQVATFDAWEGEGDKDEPTSVTLEFITSTTGVEENVPFLVKPSSAKTEVNFTADGISAADATQTVQFQYAGSGSASSRRRIISFVGTYVPVDLTPNDDEGFYPIFISNNKFYYANGNSLKGYRAYFNMQAQISGAYDKLFPEVKMAVDADPTAIESLDAEYENGNTYTIDGKFVGKNVNLNRMQKGIYIVNGKKVVNK